jgi:N-acyl homoserine lactone hydrolase
MYELHILVQGYPGKSDHGGLGWSTVALLRSAKDNVLLDTGHYMHRELLVEKLGRLGLHCDDVTALAISHCHWDHCVNFPMFPQARIYVSRTELEWAAAQPPGPSPIAEAHADKMLSLENLTRLEDGDGFLPGLEAIATPGHTPGHMAFVAKGERGEYIYTGDAVKNGSELCSSRVDSSLDLPKSLAAVRRIRERAAADPHNVVIFGHDRCCGFDGDHVHEREPLAFALTARLGEDFDDITSFDLAPR